METSNGSTKQADGQQRVVVVGAGIAGLAAAFRLKAAGFSVTVLERDQHVGGRMRTVTHHGYQLDLGAMWLSYNYREMVNLLADAGLQKEMRASSDVIGIVRGGRVHQFRCHRRTDLLRTGLLSWRSKLAALNLLKDARRAAGSIRFDDMSGGAAFDDRSVEDYCSQRLSEEVTDYLIRPLCSAFYYAPANELSVVGAFIAAQVLIGKRCFNFDGGIDVLPRRLAEQLPVRLGAQVTHVEETPSGVRVHWQDGAASPQVADVDACVVTVPAPQVPGIVPGLSAAQRSYLSRQQYAPDLGVHFGLDSPPPVDYLAAFCPPRENRDLNYVTIDHIRAPGRVPAGKGLISLRFHPHWSHLHRNSEEHEVTAAALDVLGRAIPDLAEHITAHQTTSLVYYHPVAGLVRPAGGYQDLQQFIRSLVPRARIQLAGDYFSFSTTNSALASGERAAERVRTALGPSLGELRASPAH